MGTENASSTRKQKPVSGRVASTKPLLCDSEGNMTDKNMKLWSAVSTTDPKNTKKVTLGRTFTAISPHSQIKAATVQFGPVGADWGWTVEKVEYPPNDTVAVLVRLWHGLPDNFFEQWGQNGLYTNNAKDKDDQDCMKKATTDAVTKCLSYLGFNADVFEGKFDDNRYVEQATKDAAKAEEKANWTGPLNKTKLRDEVWAVWKDVQACTDQDMLAGVVAKGVDVINQLKVDMPEVYEGGGGDKKGLAQVIDEQSAKINEGTVT